MPKVSVIIANYNYGRFLRQSVESALGQSLRPHEVIVVDDGSTDDSIEILRSFGDSVITVEQANAGVGAARNKGAETATGDFLAFLDSDDYWHAEKLEKQLRKFSSDPEFGFVQCGLTNVDENGNTLDDYLTGEEGSIADKLLRFQPVVIANTIVVKRGLFHDIGGYDTNRDLHPSEDWDLCYRLALKSKVGFVREPLHFYRHHGRGGHTNIARMERAMLIAYQKAFSSSSMDVNGYRNEAYANLYMVLAGSYYHCGQLAKSVVCGVKSIAYKPSMAGRLFAFPFRRAGNRGQGR